MQLRSFDICEERRRHNDEDIRVKSDLEVFAIFTHNDKSNTSLLLTLTLTWSARTVQLAAPTSAADGE